MRYSWVLYIGLVIMFLGCGKPASLPGDTAQVEQASSQVFEKLLIRSPYADEDLKVHLEVKDKTHINSLYAILGSATQVGKPYPTAAPYHSFEFVVPNEDSLIYDFVPYRAGEVTILFWHDKDMYSLPVSKIRDWCRDAGVSFENYVLFREVP